MQQNLNALVNNIDWRTATQWQNARAHNFNKIYSLDNEASTLGHAVMKPNIIFVNRRKGEDRREESDPCKDLDLDLCHRKRRKKRERRDQNRSLSGDYYAYVQSKGKAATSNIEKRPD